MDPAEEKFFETLVRPGANKNRLEVADAEPEVEAELAKASEVTLHVPKAAASSRRSESDDSGDDSQAEGTLTLDVYQTPEDIIVESAIAGTKPEDIDIDVTSDSIAIRGERRKEKKVEDKDYFYQECYWGKFSRSVILPQEVEPEKASVSFKNGILTVRLPKVNKKKSRKLKVRFE